MALGSTLLALPIFALVSIPLLLSACVTVSFALITLTLRLTVVYVELSYALLVNFFTVPTTTLSLLTFAASEPGSPATGRSRRNSAYGLIQPPRNKDSLTAWALDGIQEDLHRRKKKTYARSMVEAHNLPPSYYGLPVSGDEWRDFEGVGGWRSYQNLSRAKPRGSQSLHEKPLSSPSSSSAHSATGDMGIDADFDADERAWLSINQRLELPSQVVTLGTGAAASSATSPGNIDTLNLRNGGPASSLVSASGSRRDSHPGGHRHHQRSHTTSSLTTLNPRTWSGLSLALSSRPEHTGHSSWEFDHTSSAASRLAPSMTPQPYSHMHMQRTPLTRTLPTSNGSQLNGHRSDSTEGLPPSFIGGSVNANIGSNSGGYFALQRPAALRIPHLSTMGSPGSSGYNTPISMEDREASSLQLSRLMAHYPTSVRHRRRSISGPHSQENMPAERRG